MSEFRKISGIWLHVIFIVMISAIATTSSGDAAPYSITS